MKKQIKAVLVRPSSHACEWLVEKSEKHGVSVNQIVLAIIHAAIEEDASERKLRSE